MNHSAPLEMSVKQGAKLWHISHNTIYDRIKKGLLQLNENWKISPSEMTRVFLKSTPKQKSSMNRSKHPLNWTKWTLLNGSNFTHWNKIELWKTTQWRPRKTPKWSQNTTWPQRPTNFWTFANHQRPITEHKTPWTPKIWTKATQKIFRNFLKIFCFFRCFW